MKTLALTAALLLSGSVFAADSTLQRLFESHSKGGAQALFEKHSNGGAQALFEKHNQMNSDGTMKQQASTQRPSERQVIMLFQQYGYNTTPVVIHFENMKLCEAARYELERAQQGQIAPVATCVYVGN